MSALPPKADMAQRGYCHVRFVPSKLMSGAAGVTLAARHQAVVGGRLVFDRQGWPGENRPSGNWNNFDAN